MNDLVRAFFERDLTETEKNALGKILRDSPEEASHFMELGAARYAATGLPQPKWPGGGGGGGITLPASVKVIGTLVAVTGAAFLVLKAPAYLRPKEPAPVVGEVPPAPVKKAPAAPSRPAPAQAAARVTPERFEEGKRYTGLLAVVDKAASEHAEVLVADGEGRVVRHLYDGTLGRGTWVFRWDGRIESGALTPPGVYSIEVHTAGRVLRQPVTMQ